MQKLLYALTELRSFFQVAQPVLHKCLHVAHFFTAVIAVTRHQHRVNRLFFRQFSNGIGELDAAPGARFGSFQFRPDVG
ncbi:Uncharacterised protein [Salmonella enterica subsp. enterica serovar Madelia]|nr:Uncharacterised protein [Salmonella enterica subsp. enterica serovar Madelia]